MTIGDRSFEPVSLLKPPSAQQLMTQSFLRKLESTSNPLHMASKAALPPSAVALQSALEAPHISASAAAASLAAYQQLSLLNYLEENLLSSMLTPNPADKLKTDLVFLFSCCLLHNLASFVDCTFCLAAGSEQLEATASQCAGQQQTVFIN